MRLPKIAIATICTSILIATMALPTPANAGKKLSTESTIEFNVVTEAGVTPKTAMQAITNAGGTITERHDEVGHYVATAADLGFAERATATKAILAAARSVPIGQTSTPQLVQPELGVESATSTDIAKKAATSEVTESSLDPLDNLKWGLPMIRAAEARQITSGNNGVTVALIDSGIDATHPDLAPNFNAQLSRNFAPDIPQVDGPCEVPSCLDPVGVDDVGHGTHVAGIVAAAANGIGVSGVAPNVSLVTLKAGQDSGLVFLEPVVKSLLYAASIGADVANMSFHIDRWQFNCLNNPADTTEERLEQIVTIAVMTRTLEFAHNKGVTLVGSLGNAHLDLGNPMTDVRSPSFPPATSRTRQIDNDTCLSMPIEGPHVIGVSALGPSEKKADYSNYGVEQIEVSAPGGFHLDGFGTPTFNTVQNRVLSTLPRAFMEQRGFLDANGDIKPEFANQAFKQCDSSGVCGYYGYAQGTSMAAPHATGVAALIVSKFGSSDPARPGLKMAPDQVASKLTSSARDHACPEPRLQTYTNEGRDASFNAFCEGDASFNGFYGHGIVNALAAVT